MWRVIRSSVGSDRDDRKLPNIPPGNLNRFFVGVGSRVAGKCAICGEAPHLPTRLPRVGDCAIGVGTFSKVGWPGISRDPRCTHSKLKVCEFYPLFLEQAKIHIHNK